MDSTYCDDSRKCMLCCDSVALRFHAEFALRVRNHCISRISSERLWTAQARNIRQICVKVEYPSYRCSLPKSRRYMFPSLTFHHLKIPKTIILHHIANTPGPRSRLHIHHSLPLPLPPPLHLNLNKSARKPPKILPCLSLPLLHSKIHSRKSPPYLPSLGSEYGVRT